MDRAECFVPISFLHIQFHVQKNLRITCVENEQLHSEITVLSVLNLSYIQLLSEYIICAIVLQIHFVDIYQHNNQLCLHYNQT